MRSKGFRFRADKKDAEVVNRWMDQMEARLAKALKKIQDLTEYDDTQDVRLEALEDTETIDPDALLNDDDDVVYNEDGVIVLVGGGYSPPIQYLLNGDGTTIVNDEAVAVIVA